MDLLLHLFRERRDRDRVATVLRGMPYAMLTTAVSHRIALLVRTALVKRCPDHGL